MNAVQNVLTKLGVGGKSRLPFCGLVLVAMPGILAGVIFPIPPLWWIVPAVLCLLATFFPSISALFWMGIACTFAAVQAGNQEWAGSRRLLELASEKPGYFVATGEVLQTPKAGTTNRVSFPVSLRSIAPEGSEQMPFAGRVAVRWVGPPPSVGDLVRITGRIQPLQGPRNPGEFDYRAWQIRNKIHAEIFSNLESECSILASGQGNPILALAAGANQKISTLLGVGISWDPTAVSLLRAMTLGDMSGLGEEWLERFRITGTLHLFSVSGLHVGMLAMLLWFGLKPLRLPPPVQILLIIGLLFFYAAVTGLKPPSLRAAFMASVVLAGLLLNRPITPLNSLSAAAFFLLLIDPDWLFHPGFQLSFLVVVSILALGSPLQRWLKERAGPDPFLPIKLYGVKDKTHAWLTRGVGGLAAVSITAWLGSLPLIAIYYHLISLSAIPCNLAAVPLAFFVLAIALISLVTGMVWLGFADIFNHANLLLATALLGVVEVGANLPLSSVRWGSPTWLAPSSEMVIFDYGAGGAAYLRVGKKLYLVDTGSAYHWKSGTGPFLLKKGTHRLDGVFLTHGDSKHVGGAGEALRKFQPGFVAVSSLRDRSRVFQTVKKSMAAAGIPKRILLAGDILPIAPGWTMEVLYPPPGISMSYSDDKSLVLKIVGPEIRFLFLGDAGLAVEDWLLEHKKDRLPADLLITGRHISGQPGRADFLDAVRPRAIITSAAEFPTSEQVPEAWETAILQRGIPFFRQDETGAVTVQIQNESVLVSPFLPNRPALEW